jgi:hypothetical protein
VFQSFARRKPGLDADVYAIIAGWTSILNLIILERPRTAAMCLPSE